MSFRWLLSLHVRAGMERSSWILAVIEAEPSTGLQGALALSFVLFL